MRSSGAFSLIELIATVGIIAILAALLLPAVIKGIDEATSAKCLGNLKQLSAASVAYSSDNNGKLIPICAGSGSADAKTWRLLVYPYVGSNAAVFRCPADKFAQTENFDLSHGTSPDSYGINGLKNVNNQMAELHQYLNQTSGASSASVVHPSRTIMIADTAKISNPSASPSQWIDSQNPTSYGYIRTPNDSSFTGDSWGFFPRHGGRYANAVFYDGHAESVDVGNNIMAYPVGNPNCLYDNQ